MLLVYLASQVDSTTEAVIRGQDSARSAAADPSDTRVLQGSQANNCYVFPGIGLGAIAAAAADVSEGMLLAAARTLAGTTHRYARACTLCT